MGRLSKSDKYAIQFLHSEHKSIEEICSELDCTPSQVKKIIQSKLEEKKPTTAPTKTDKTKNLMIRQTSAKKSNTVSIMTEPASQLSDEFVKNIKHNIEQKTQKYIFRPKNS